MTTCVRFVLLYNKCPRKLPNKHKCQYYEVVKLYIV